MPTFEFETKNVPSSMPNSYFKIRNSYFKIRFGHGAERIYILKYDCGWVTSLYDRGPDANDILKYVFDLCCLLLGLSSQLNQSLLRPLQSVKQRRVYFAGHPAAANQAAQRPNLPRNLRRARSMWSLRSKVYFRCIKLGVKLIRYVCYFCSSV